MPDLLYSDKARKALQASLSPRFRRLDRLERYVTGTQYEGRPSFWDSDHPVADRDPCINYPIVSSAIRSHIDLSIGADRFPSLTSFVDEDDSEFDDSGLSDDDSELLDRGVRVFVEQSRLQSVAREALASAMACGTAVVIASIRNGKLHLDTTRAKWCTPKFDSMRPNVVESLEIKYPYLEEYYDKTERKWAERCMLYRRVIDANADVTYLPQFAAEDGIEPTSWTRDNAKSVDHGLGFCPVVWYKFLPECSTVDEIDGTAIHAHLTDEIDALNQALSQKHVASLVAASPPTVEIGVDETVQPAEMGRNAHSAWLPGDPNENRQWINVHKTLPKTVRKRGPGIIWRYPSKDSKVEQLTLAGDALKPVDDNCRDLRSKLAEALAVVFTDLENQRTTLDISGRALREQHKRQIERCDVIRDDFGANFLMPVVDVLTRLVLSTQPAKLRVPGAAKVAPLLARFMVDVESDQGVTQEWSPPRLNLVWGDYFTPSELDQKAIVDATIEALDSGLITKRTAVERLSDFYTIGDVDEYLDALEQEAEEKQQKALENAQNMAALAPPVPNTPPKPGAPKPGVPQKPKPAPGVPA